MTGHPPHEKATTAASITSTIASADVEMKSLPSDSSAIKLIKRIAVTALHQTVASRPAMVAELIDLLS